MGISIPTLCHYRGLSPYGACRVCLVEIDTPRGTAAGRLVQLSGRRGPGRPHRHGSGAGVAAHRAGTAPGRGPAIAGAGPVGRGAGRQPHAAGTGRRRQVHPLRAVRADVQRPDGPRRDQHVRPRRQAPGRHRLPRAERPVPGLRGVRLRLPHRGDRPGHDHRPAARSRT